MNKSPIITVTHDAIFDLVRSTTPVEDLRFSIHIPSGVPGGLSLLESSILVTLLKFVNPGKIFEFGTFLGATSALLAINSDENTHLTTLDLESSKIDIQNVAELDLTYKSDNDDYLRNVYQQRGTPYIDNLEENVLARVKQIHCDSKELDVRLLKLCDQFDFIFIDGGHDLDIISKDTLNALLMAKKDAVIIWHDYQSNVHTDVTDYLDTQKELAPIYHVQHTMLAVYPLGRFQEKFKTLAKV